jgi:hypothetical protein
VFPRPASYNLARPAIIEIELKRKPVAEEPTGFFFIQKNATVLRPRDWVGADRAIFRPVQAHGEGVMALTVLY